MKHILLLGCACILLPALSVENGLLFRATYDGYNTAPDYAVNTAHEEGGIDPELQLRMHPDASGGRGNALALETGECVVYPARGNFRPDRGTVSFWVKPMNYTLSDKRNYQIFFQANTPDHALFVYKYGPYSDTLLFYIRAFGVTQMIRARASWREGDWHKVDVVWSPNRMTVYIDGRLPPKHGDYYATRELDPPFKLPREAASGTLRLNNATGWENVPTGRQTAYDEFEIWNRPLSAREVFENFAKKAPARAKGLAAEAEVPADEGVKLSYECFPNDKKLTVRMDLAAANLPTQQRIPVRLSLVDMTNQAVAVTADVQFPEPDSPVDFSFGDRLREGHTYELRAEVPGTAVRAKTVLRVPDLTFLKHRVGVDEAVPEPWTPVMQKDAATFEVLDRTYVFERGIFPTRLVSRGKSILVEAPRLTINGAPVSWGEPTVVARTASSVRLAAEGRCGALRITGAAELAFDGFCKIDLTLDPATASVPLDSMRLAWSVAPVAGRYVLAPLYKPWKNDRIDLRFGAGAYENPILWLTGPEVGLCWWCESDANWVRAEKSPDVHVVRSPAKIAVTVDVIARAAVLNGRAARYTMGFQATPPKHPDRLYRIANYGNDNVAGSNWKTCGWGSASGERHMDNILHWTSLVPTHPKDYVAYIRGAQKNGLAVLQYSMPTHLSPLDDVWDWFYPTWKKNPGARWDFIDELTKRNTRVVPCCAGTGAADWHLANAERLFDLSPELRGLYYDISTCDTCDNARHGHGGVDAFGRAYASSMALDLRAYFIRVRKLLQARGKRLHVHAHNRYFPFVHSFADACWPGEEQFHAYVENPRNHYVEGVGAEEYEAAYSSEIRGMGIHLIAQNQRAVDLQPEVAARDPEAYLGREAVLATLMPSLVYDFKCLAGFGKGHAPCAETWAALAPLKMENADFHPYWVEPIVSCAPGIRCGVYTWRAGEGPRQFLIVVGNFTRAAVDPALAIDWKKLGVAPAPLEELMTHQPYAPAPLRAHGFLLLAPAATTAVTPGWENIKCAERELPRAELVWSAPQEGFSLVREDGAEGTFAVSNGVVTVHKTNARGRLVVTAPAFAVQKGRVLRFSADVEVSGANPETALGHLAAWSTTRSVSSTDRISQSNKWFSAGGEYMRRLVNTTPGTPYRKYMHLDPDGTTATVAIVVSGTPSVSRWSHLAAEDFEAARAIWAAHHAKIQAPDRSAERIDRAAFDRALAADRDHTAQVVVRDGVSRLLIDGAVEPAILYKACEWSKTNMLTYAGRKLQQKGVRLGGVNLRLGDLGLPGFHGPWSAAGFDVQAAVERIRNHMRLGEHSLFILALGTSAYPAFTEKEHPDEVWIKEDGSVAYGNSGSVIPDLYNDGGKLDPGDRRWPWVSLASPAWRAAIKRVTGELFAELRRQGLMKRIIGVHFYGYHDGQFAMPIADYSPCAKADYARYLAARGLKPTDPEGSYFFYTKQLGFRALEDFSREAKRLAGKPIVAAKWEMSPFNISFDVSSFLRSDAVDAIIPQAHYSRRIPGLSQGPRLPIESLHRHGKMLWIELDMRTYAAVDKWAHDVIAAKGLATAEDDAMWATMYRKNAAIMTAHRMGWWHYDMANGWYTTEGIARTIGEVYAMRRELDARKPDLWRPDVAFVIDEAALAGYKADPAAWKIQYVSKMVTYQWPTSARAGVPYDSYLADDFIGDAKLSKSYKAVALAGFLEPRTPRQQALVDRLAAAGVKTMIVPKDGFEARDLHSLATSAGAFVAAPPDVVQVDMNGDFLSVHDIVPGTYEIRLPFCARAVNLKDGSETVADRLTLTLSGGETCWFRLFRR